MNKSQDGYGYNNNLPIDGMALEQDYYDLFYASDGGGEGEAESEDRFSAMLRVAFVLTSRVGFMMVQAASIPIENVYVIILHNVLQIAVVLLSYGLIGSRVSFGVDTHSGWIARGGWNKEFSFEFNLDYVVIGFCGCLLATAQTSSFLVGRISLVGDVLLTTFYCALFQPLLMHWIWAEAGWMKLSNFLGQEVFAKDHAGALTLHIPSVLFGTIGALFLGRRIVRLKEVDKLSFGTENALTTFLGYLFIILGYVIFSLPSSVYEESHIPPPYNFSTVVLLNSLLAIGGGIFMSTILLVITFRHMYNYRRIVRCVQGGMAGLISVAAAVDRYTPIAAVLISLGSSALFFFFAEILHSTALEDPCSFISSHLICGLVGVLLCPILAQKENLGVEIPPLGTNMVWQLICTVVVIGFSVVVSLFVFLLLKILRLLRNKHEVASHRRATVLRDSMAKTGYLQRLFPINTATHYVEPGYREKYMDVARQVEPKKNISSVSHPVSETVRKRDRHDNKFNATVMTVNTELNASGDYYDPYLDIKSVPDSNESRRSIL